MLIAIKQNHGRFLKVHGNFGGGFRQTFPNPQVDRHVRPTPVIQKQAKRDVGFGFRIAGSLFLPRDTPEPVRH